MSASSSDHGGDARGADGTSEASRHSDKALSPSDEEDDAPSGRQPPQGLLAKVLPLLEARATRRDALLDEHEGGLARLLTEWEAIRRWRETEELAVRRGKQGGGRKQVRLSRRDRARSKAAAAREQDSAEPHENDECESSDEDDLRRPLSSARMDLLSRWPILAPSKPEWELEDELRAVQPRHHRIKKQPRFGMSAYAPGGPLFDPNGPPLSPIELGYDVAELDDNLSDASTSDGEDERQSEQMVHHASRTFDALLLRLVSGLPDGDFPSLNEWEAKKRKRGEERRRRREKKYRIDWEDVLAAASGCEGVTDEMLEYLKNTMEAIYGPAKKPVASTTTSPELRGSTTDG